MKTISIRQLHERTGEWVRAAAAHEAIVVTDSGKPVAVISPHRAPAIGNKFKNRKLLPAYAKVMGKLRGGTDSTQAVSEDRDRGSDW
jgi:prevent-host-death family protein